VFGQYSDALWGGLPHGKIVLDEMFFGLLEAASSEGRAQCQIAL
jgi:hypothetical protein